MSFSIGNIQFLELQKLPLIVAVARRFGGWFILSALMLGGCIGSGFVLFFVFPTIALVAPAATDAPYYWEAVSRTIVIGGISLAVGLAASALQTARTDLLAGKYRKYVVRSTDYTLEVIQAASGPIQHRVPASLAIIREVLSDEVFIRADERVRDAGKLGAEITPAQLESRAHVLNLLTANSRLRGIIQGDQLRDKAKGIAAHLHLQIIRANQTLEWLEKITGTRV